MDSYVCRLDCDHSVSSAVPLVLGADVNCARCQRVGMVMEVNAVYRWKCVQHGKLSVSYGAAEYTCQRAMDKHGRTFPTHVLQLWRGTVVVAVRKPQRFLQELPFSIDEPPF